MTTIDTATIDEAKILELAQELIRQYPPSTTSVIDFLGAQFDMGLAWVHFPVGHGGLGANPKFQKTVNECVYAAGAPNPMYRNPIGHGMCGPTVVEWGSEEQKKRYLRPLFTGEEVWCQLFSEPGSGSDFAGLSAKGEKDGDEWICNGQKVWTSGAKGADIGMLIARTDWDQPKHRGISFFYFPMKQPGVEVRPLRQATGDSRFNEVFITDARVPHANLLGDLNKGWWVLQSALAYERAAMGISRRGPRGPGGATSAAHGSIPSPDLSLVKVAQQAGKSNDHVIRQKLARLYCMRLVNDWNGDRAKAVSEAGGSSPLASFGKLAMSGILHYAGHLHSELLGAEGALDGDANPSARDANYSHLNAYFTSIGGGTDQIQRNIIGEMILGLPKEPQLDREMPFREVPATARK